MKITAIIIFTQLGLLTGSAAQKKGLSLSLGPELLVPTYKEISSLGYGAGAEAGIRFSERISGIADISYNYFPVKLKYIFINDTRDGFSVIPALFGIKYHLNSNFYLAGKAGVVIGLLNAGTHLTLSPAAGYLLKFDKKNKIDIGLKLIGVLRGYSFSENPYSFKGGYTFISCRIAYIF